MNNSRKLSFDEYVTTLEGTALSLPVDSLEWEVAKRAWFAALQCVCGVGEDNPCPDCPIALAQQAQPLTDDEIVAEAQRYHNESNAGSRLEVFMDGATWARDRMAQQARPEMPTREMIAAALLHYRRTVVSQYNAVGESHEMADAVLALFAPKETT